MIFPKGLLKPVQEPHAKVLLDSLYLNGVANDLSDCGAGKSYVGTAIAKAMNRPVFVVCPKTIRGKWTTLLNQWGAKILDVINYEKLVRGNTKWLKYSQPPKGPNGKPITDYPRHLLTHLQVPSNALVILDEAHRCKAVSSLSAGIMIDCKRQDYRFLNLSATLACDPREMKAIGYANNLIKTPTQKDYKAFCIDHGATWLGRWGALLFDKDSPDAQKKMKAIHKSLFEVQKSASRLTRAQMSEYFSTNHVDATAYSMDDVTTCKIQKVYDWLQAELDKLAEHCDGYTENVLTLILRARQQIELLKVPLFCELIEDSYDEGNSVVCFVNFTRSLEAIEKRLSARKDLRNTLAFIRGGQKMKEREAYLTAFQADQKRVMLANQRAGGIAVDMHDCHGNYPRRTLLSPTFDAREILQALGRADRVGGKTPVYQTLVYVAGTIEAVAVKRVQGKCDNMALLNDGDLNCGISFLRKI